MKKQVMALGALTIVVLGLLVAIIVDISITTEEEAFAKLNDALEERNERFIEEIEELAKAQKGE